MNPISALVKLCFSRTLRDRGPALTFARLCTSRHLQDLQWIAFFIIVFSVLALGIILKDLGMNSPFTGVLFVTAAAALNWTYQTGSRRIGAVDLFACEISVICRVFIVIDYAKLCVASAKREPDPHIKSIADLDPLRKHPGGGSKKFTSEEHYTPVYDNHLSELEPLDVNAVTYVTEFYTYRKTMVDYLRAISVAEDIQERSRLTSEMIYMQFLMFESARLAVEELIEFEPNRAESLVNILCSELVLFGYLLNHYKDDYRGKRLRLRCKTYERIVSELYGTITKQTHENWIKAKTSAPELMQRYHDMRAALSPNN